MRWRHCPCEWGVWDCVQLCVVLLPLSGASWADSIQMVHQRTPDVAVAAVCRLSDEGPLDGCLEELREAATELERKRFWWQPSWAELRDGKRPPQNDARDPGV